MKKTNRYGFVLLETLIVTVFISGVLIFLFTQFVSLNRNYEKSYNYNSVEDIYASNNIANYIKHDLSFYNKIETEMDEYFNITDCSMLTNVDFCKKLFEYEEVDNVLVTKNKFDKSYFLDLDEDLNDFINQITPKGNEKYRLIIRFKHKVEQKIKNIENSVPMEKTFEHNTFATIRFGDDSG